MDRLAPLRQAERVAQGTAGVRDLPVHPPSGLGVQSADASTRGMPAAGRAVTTRASLPSSRRMNQHLWRSPMSLERRPYGIVPPWCGLTLLIVGAFPVPLKAQTTPYGAVI